MTLGLGQWLRLLGLSVPNTSYRPRIQALDVSRLPARDIADLNLPVDVLSRLGARQAGEDRRRSYR